MRINHLKTLALLSLTFHLSACSISSSIQDGIADALGLNNKPILDTVDHVQYYNSLTSSPSISWSISLSSTAVSEYHYSIGTSAGNTDTVSWTSAGMNTSLNLNSLSLIEGETYYVSVKASGVAPDNLESDVVSSSGWLVDVTAPTTPGTLDDGVLQANLTETNTLTWTASTDALSGIDFYEVALGTAPGNTDTLSWTNVGNVTSRKLTGLSLVSGTTYYASVRAVDRAGNRSGSTNSDGWLAGPFCSNKTTWLTYNANGAGTLASPYLICNAAQLANIGNTPAALSSSYKLMGDIDLAPYYAAPNPQFKIGSCGAGGCSVWDGGAFLFTGNFDGGGHTISNFSFSSPGTRGIGFFAGTWTGARIHNLKLTQVSVSGGTQSGGFIGSAQFVAVHNVSVAGNITGSGSGIGGVIGTSYHLVIGNSSFNGSISSNSESTGGIIGKMEESSLFSCLSSGTITSSINRVGGLVGNIVGRSPSRISNSYSSSVITGTTDVGGLIGELSVDRSMIQKSYFTGSATATSGRVGGITGRSTSNTQIKDSYSVGSINGTTGSGSVGYLVGNLNGSITNSYYWSGSACDSTGSGGSCGNSGLSHAALNTFYNKAQPPMNSWDDLATTADGNNNFWSFNGTEHAKVWFETELVPLSDFTLGSGTSTDPYQISTIEQFKKIGQNPRYMNKSFRLTNAMNFFAGGFIQIGGSLAPYSGQFYGNNKMISNVTNIQAGDDGVGIFGIVASNGRIENLVVQNATISARSDVGGVVGLLDASGFTNVMIDLGSVTASGDFVGGVMGRMAKTEPTQIGSQITVNGQNYVGGVAGEIYAGSIRQSYSKGNVTGLNQIGGTVGYQLAGGVHDSYSTGNVNSSGDYVGGLVGQSDWSGIYRSYSTAAVSGELSVGGAVGYINNSTIENVFAANQVTGTGGSSEVGFLLGTTNAATITSSYYWSGASCDSTGVGGLCNTSSTSGVANVDDFKFSDNAPLLNWDFNTIWTEVVSQFPILTFE